MNFNEARTTAQSVVVEKLSGKEGEVLLVRDLYGRFRILLPDALSAEEDNLASAMVDALGVYTYSADSVCLSLSDLPGIQVARSEIIHDEDGLRVCLLDRLLIGTEWSAKPLDEATSPKRFTLFSMKGGVGRSTTAAVLAWHLASKGKRVLVFDLDLESPGVGATLLGESLPKYGIVDWFVEDALGQGDAFLPDLVAESALGDSTNGRIAVVPAFGSDTGDYLAKLGRAYLERGPAGHERWPERLQRFVEAIEDRENPDVVLLDSRSGLHDTSAALVLAMGANTLLFAVDTEQTWSAYRFLFEHWRKHPDRKDFRDKLWVLGATVPDTERESYLQGLRDNAWTLFNDTFYDEAEAAPDPDAFTFAAADEAGNHYPRPIYWLRSLMAFDPLSFWAEHDVAAAYGEFLGWFDRVLLDGGGATP